MNSSVFAVKVPCLTVSYVVVELQRLILGKNTYRIDPRIDAVGERVIDDPVFSPEGYSGLRGVLGKNVQSASLPSGEKHGYAFLFA